MWKTQFKYKYWSPANDFVCFQKWNKLAAEAKVKYEEQMKEYKKNKVDDEAPSKRYFSIVWTMVCKVFDCNLMLICQDELWERKDNKV